MLKPPRAALGAAFLLPALLVLAGCSAQRDPFTSAKDFATPSIPSSAEPSAPTPSPPSPRTPSPSKPGASSPSPRPRPPAPGPAPFHKSALSLDAATSIWVVTNKLRPLHPLNYAPSDIVTAPVPAQNPPRMRKVAAGALVQMFAASAKEGGGRLQVQSAWRPYSVQVSVYNGWVHRLGKAQADRQSARPGYSEHQTGLAVDISPIPLSCPLAACFGGTPQGKWLAANAWRFGYLLRYPQDKTPITGFTYEPWHFRYIGVPLSTKMHKQGVQTLEEFFGLPAAPDYAR